MLRGLILITICVFCIHFSTGHQTVRQVWEERDVVEVEEQQFVETVTVQKDWDSKNFVILTTDDNHQDQDQNEQDEPKSAPAPVQGPPSAIKSGEQLNQGQCLTSPNRAYTACMQADGNFVVYQGEKTLWSTNTAAKGAAPFRMFMQADTHLVLYDTKSEPTWVSHTSTRGVEPSRLVMQDDSNLVIYDSNNKPVWSWIGGIEPNPDMGSTLQSTKVMVEKECLVSANKIYKACLQIDGNFCVYKNDQGIWCNTLPNKGERPRRLTMQPDNNLVEYDTNHQNLWQTGTNGKINPPGRLTIQDDGNLVIYAGNGAALWSWMGGLIAK
jgi:hypothetical protein